MIFSTFIQFFRKRPNCFSWNSAPLRQKLSLFYLSPFRDRNIFFFFLNFLHVQHGKEGKTERKYRHKTFLLLLPDVGKIKLRKKRKLSGRKKPKRGKNRSHLHPRTKMARNGRKLLDREAAAEMRVREKKSKSAPNRIAKKEPPPPLPRSGRRREIEILFDASVSSCIRHFLPVRIRKFDQPKTGSLLLLH